MTQSKIIVVAQSRSRGNLLRDIISREQALEDLGEFRSPAPARPGVIKLQANYLSRQGYHTVLPWGSWQFDSWDQRWISRRRDQLMTALSLVWADISGQYNAARPDLPLELEPQRIPVRRYRQAIASVVWDRWVLDRLADTWDRQALAYTSAWYEDIQDLSGRSAWQPLDRDYLALTLNVGEVQEELARAGQQLNTIFPQVNIRD